MTAKIDWYREILELEPNSKVFFPLARLVAEAGDRDEAIKLLEKGLDRHPEFLEARLFCIELLHQSGRTQECNAEIAKLSKMFASYAGFWQAWAACLASEHGQSDTSSLIRFLAANFVSGPLQFHEVLNRGLDAMLKEGRAQPAPEPTAEALPVKEEILDAIDPPAEGMAEIDTLEPASQEENLPEPESSEEALASELDDAASAEALPDEERELPEAEPETELSAAEPLEGNADLPAEEPFESADLPAVEPLEAAVEAIAAEALGSGPDLADEQANAQAEQAATVPEAGQMEAGGAETFFENAGEMLADLDSELNLEDAEALDTSEAQAPEAEPVAELELPEAEPEDAASLPVVEMDESPASVVISEEAELLPEDATDQIEREAEAALAQAELQASASVSQEQASGSVSKRPMTAEEAEAALVGDLELPGMEEADGAEIMARPTEIAEEAAPLAPEEKGASKAPAPSLADDAGEEEPEEQFSLRTRSMAEVLAEQGDIRGALDIYQELAAAATSNDELEDINRRMSTLRGRLELANASSGFSAAEEASAARNREKLIDMLEALAQRVEARAG